MTKLDIHKESDELGEIINEENNGQYCLGFVLSTLEEFNVFAPEELQLIKDKNIKFTSLDSFIVRKTANLLGFKLKKLDSFSGLPDKSVIVYKWGSQYAHIGIYEGGYITHKLGDKIYRSTDPGKF